MFDTSPHQISTHWCNVPPLKYCHFALHNAAGNKTTRQL